MTDEEKVSDNIQKISTQFGGDAQDWQMIAMKKSAAGEWERKFENTTTGKTIIATEKADGTFTFSQPVLENLPGFFDGLVKKASEKYSEPLNGLKSIFRKAIDRIGGNAADTGKSAPEKAQDAAPVDQESLADSIVARMQDGEDVSAEELQQAGTALANRFGFGIGYREDEYLEPGETPPVYILIDLAGGSDDECDVLAYVEHLLPDGVEQDSAKEFSYRGDLQLADVAEDLMRRGFALDDELQASVDEGMKKPLHADMQALFAKVRGAGKGSKPSGPGAPKP